MYLRAGIFSLGLLLLSRLLGLARESVQAAAFGSSALGDVVIVMFTLPDLLVGIFISGALSYALLPHWASQSVGNRNRSQTAIGRQLLWTGLLCGLTIWILRDYLAGILAPGLKEDLRMVGGSALVWSAAVLPLAMLAALGSTRLQYECDFVGTYTGNLLVNVALVAGLLWVTEGQTSDQLVTVLGIFLVLAMVARLMWIAWRLRESRKFVPKPVPYGDAAAEASSLPGAAVWVWAAAASGLLLILPLVARSIASTGGEGSLSNFNYAWKLVELPLVLAVQLVASVAFPAIVRTGSGTPEREKAFQIALLLAWALACAAVAVVGSFSLPIARLLFAWGRMDADKIVVIAQWSAIGVWSLLPQAVIAVLLTVMASAKRMHLAVWAYLAALLVLLVWGWTGSSSDAARGASVMWMLNAVTAGVAIVLAALEWRGAGKTFPLSAALAPLLTCSALISLKSYFADLSPLLTMITCSAYALLVITSALMTSTLLRITVTGGIRQTAAPAKF